jgi:hypothetical protein
MGTHSFDDFVKRQQESGRAFDWVKEKDEWLRQLDVLYNSVSDYLHPYVEEGEIKIAYRDATLTEEDVGAYPVKELTITIGRSQVQLEPIGTRILGAKGRVDVTGPRGRLQLLLVDKKAKSTNDLIRFTVTIGDGPSQTAPSDASNEPVEFVWKFLMPPPQRQLLALNKDLFLQFLMEIVNG